MIIDDSDAFRTWLTVILKPICDADPGALAKYIYALVRKDKPPVVLKQIMTNQLQVFLQDETEGFLEKLFKTLENKEYLTPVIPSANPPNPNVPPTSGATATAPVASTDPLASPTRISKEIIPVSELANLSEAAVNGVAKKDQQQQQPTLESKREARKSESEKEDKVRRRSRHRSVSRNRSRSRSWDRNRRSREKSREPYREKQRERSRPYRNKSPPRRYDRSRRSRSGSVGRVRSRSRSPRHSYRGRYRNRSPPRSTSRSRSRSPDAKKDRSVKDAKDGVGGGRSGAATPTQDSNHGDADLQLTSTTQSIQSVVAQTNRSPKKRCRDYDEKGYCMRGEMCPYDHGVDPVVLEDTALSRVLAYNPNGTQRNDAPPPIIAPPMIPGPGHPVMHHMQPRPLLHEYNPQAPHMWHRSGFRGPRTMLGGGPRVPQIGGGGGAFLPQSNLQQRELISVPVHDNNQQPHDQFGGNNHSGGFVRQPYGQHDVDAPDVVGGGGGGGIVKRKAFDYNRLGPRSKNPTNCSLELKKIPPGLNNITHLNEHFAKFGKIVNIQVFYEGDPEAAIVTFSSHAEANAAYRSTEAVLNNRFIKVFWHTSCADGKQENVPPRSVKDRLGHHNTVAPNSNKVLNLAQAKTTGDGATDDMIPFSADGKGPHNNSFTKNNVVPVVNKEESKAQAAAAIKKSQELLAAKEKIKKNQEEKRKEALKLSQDLTKRQQELLEKQVAQQKLLVEKMEKTPAGSKRDLLLETIKKSQEATEAIRKVIAQSTAAAVKSSSTPLVRKSKEEVQKEVLDAELDLITKQQEGVIDTAELQKRLMDLKAKANISSPNARKSARGRRFNPVASRHLLSKNNLVDNGTKSYVKPPSVFKSNTFQKHAVDHRPTKLLVSGYEADEQDAVINQFSQYGEIIDYVNDPATPSTIFNFKVRKEAEVAFVKGKHFQNRTLSVTWATNSEMNNPLSRRTSTRTVLLSESDEDHLIEQNLVDVDGPADVPIALSEEALLQDDEEDDEDNEGRSWRR